MKSPQDNRQDEPGDRLDRLIDGVTAGLIQTLFYWLDWLTIPWLIGPILLYVFIVALLTKDAVREERAHFIAFIITAGLLGLIGLGVLLNRCMTKVADHYPMTFDPQMRDAVSRRGRPERKRTRGHWIIAGVWIVFAISSLFIVARYVTKTPVEDSARAVLLFMGVLAVNGSLLALNLLAHLQKLHRRLNAVASDFLPALNLIITAALLALWYLTQIASV